MTFRTPKLSETLCLPERRVRDQSCPLTGITWETSGPHALLDQTKLRTLKTCYLANLLHDLERRGAINRNAAIGFPICLQRTAAAVHFIDRRQAFHQLLKAI